MSNSDTEWREWCGKISELAALWQDVDLALGPTRAAQSLGLKNAATLHARLRSMGLPTYGLLRDWYYLICLLERDANRRTVSAELLSRGRDPASVYRFVLRFSGLRWSEWKELGVERTRQRALAIWKANCRATIHSSHSDT
jgi:hypothetical protein